MYAMLEWFKGHCMGEYQHNFEGKTETIQDLGPIGHLQVNASSHEGLLIEGNHRLLLTLLLGGGFFPIRVYASEFYDEGFGDVSNLTFYRAVAGSTTRPWLGRPQAV